MRLLLIGSTGLVGGHVLDQALADPRVTAVVAPVRRPTARVHPKLSSPPIDFEHLDPDASWWHADAVICTLGTTMKRAGAKAAFRRVDHDYPLEAARLARTRGTPTYVLNSAIGADVDSRFFYNRIKGELEQDLLKEGFVSITFVRPGLIGGGRAEFRLGERVSAGVLNVLGPILPRRWRVNPATRIAEALLTAALAPQPGQHVVTAEHLI